MQKMQQAVIVTGAGRRLGAALVAHALAQGWQVIGVYRTRTPEVVDLQQRGAVMIAADLATDAGVAQCIADIRQQVVSVRALIHNASIWHTDAHMQVNVGLRDATYHLHVFAPHTMNLALSDVLSAGDGVADIIHITDANAPFAKADHALYVASKAAMESMMRSHAQRLAPQVKVNAIAPGLLAFHTTDDATYRAHRLSKIPLGFEPGFGVVVDAVQYVMQCAYMTGQVLTLDGGQAIQ
jgi:dihydromonapterin reductase/dihydrofolate reductase